MDEITVVRRRSRVWPIVIALIVVALIALAVLWMMGNQPVVDIGWNQVLELGRRSTRGIT
jgi:hypothetical protein